MIRENHTEFDDLNKTPFANNDTPIANKIIKMQNSFGFIGINLNTN